MKRPPEPLRSAATGALTGVIKVPGDKSISHRSLMISALARGETLIDGLLEGEDVLHTAAAMTALGAKADRLGDGRWRVAGAGLGRLTEPETMLDMGNSGTAARLLIGLVAAYPFTSFFSGDASLNRRPMGRVITPLEQMGARFVARAGGKLPLAVIGTGDSRAIDYAPREPSAQVKSAILLAGLMAEGTTTVTEVRPTRDHTELMLRHFGAEVVTEPTPSGGLMVALRGRPVLQGCLVRVPGDASSAAFVTVATLIRPGSSVTITGVGLNPHRTGLYDTLLEMGADIRFHDRRVEAGEPVADLEVRASRLDGTVVPASRAPSMIDEYPILSVAAAYAHGVTRMEGLAELKVKESDRLGMMAAGLAASGVQVSVEGDTLSVTGSGSAPPGGATVATAMDHRIAMSFLVLGMGSATPIAIDDGRFIDTSFPGFVALMNGLGAAIDPA